MSDPNVEIHCCTHGLSIATYVCRHLITGNDLGFFCAEEDAEEDDPCPDAWCGDCDQILTNSGGEWTDESEAAAQVTQVCQSCYMAIRERNATAAS